MNTQAPLRVAPDQPMGNVSPHSAAEDGGFEIDVRALWSMFYRSRYLVALIIGLCLILGLVATLLMTRIYRADASLQIEQQSTRVLSTGGVQPDDVAPIMSAQEGDRFLQTQLDVLRSRALAIRVMQNLNLLNGGNFIKRMGIKPLSRPLGDLDMPASRREQLIRTLLQYEIVALPRNSRIAQVSFVSPDPVLAATIANSFVKNFIALNLERRYDTSTYARSFLENQLAETKQRLEESERATIAYARQAGLIDASAGTPSAADAQLNGPRSLTTSDLVQTNLAHSQAQTQRIDAQQRYLQALRTPLMSLPEVMSNYAIQQLTQQRALAQAAYDQERQRHMANYPTIQQAAAQLASLDKQITAIAMSVRNGLRDQYLTALKQEQALSGNVTALKLDTLAEQDRSIRYNILKRETDTNRTMYDGLLQRYKEVSAAAGLTANNLSVVDIAETPPKPISPRPLINLLLSLVVGTAIAIATVFARERFDDAIRSPEDIQQKLGLTFLNTVPLLTGVDDPIATLEDPRSAISEAYAALRTSLELSIAGGVLPSILLTSTRQSEGKTTTAYALARDFAKIGRKVVLIDSDLRKPSLHRNFGLSNNAGFSSVLANSRSIEDVIQETAIPNLSFISSGPLPPNPASLLSGPMLPEQMAKLRDLYDLVIVDGPPVLGLADTALLSASIDGTVFVVEASGSHRGHAKAAIRRLTASGARMIGAVLTKFDARAIGYGHEYGYSYAYSYGQ